MPPPECSLACQCPLTLCAAFTASRLGANSINGYYNHGEFVSNTDGIIALCEGLKESAMTSLECAAAPKCLPFCQRPLTLLNTSLHSRARSLRGNKIGPEGAAALAEGLKGNSTLRSLE